MKSTYPLILSATFLAVFLTSCSGGSSGYNPDIGPFDENGNYVEEWADNPPKRGTKRREARKSQKSTSSSSEKKKKERTSSRRKKPEVKPTVIQRPSSWDQPKPKVTRKPKVTTKSKPQPKPKAKPRPKPKAQAKPKPKPKAVKVTPRYSRYTVRKGDTLYSLSRRFGTRVSVLRTLNKISGNNIRVGQSLLVPKK